MRKGVFMNRTNYSVIGSGYIIKIFDKSHPLYIKLKSVKDLNLADYLSSYNSLKDLKLEDNMGNLYNSFYEVRANKLFMAYSIDTYTRLEIKNKDSKRLKVFFKELVRTDFLFEPFYELKQTVLQNEGLLVIEYDKGYFGFTNHPTQFSIEDKLSFEVLTIPELNVKCIRTMKVNNSEIEMLG